MFNPFPNKPWYLRVCSTNILKTLCEKEKLLVTSNFSFCHSVFSLLGELSAIFIRYELVNCKLLVWRSLKFVVWKGLTSELFRCLVKSKDRQKILWLYVTVYLSDFFL